ncbi:hypothetical protein LC607_29610 [Nostoc sp. CHAB 5824]|nr:hypothetical protein [Nostoc sp. CHAB 5824]
MDSNKKDITVVVFDLNGNPTKSCKIKVNISPDNAPEALNNIIKKIEKSSAAKDTFNLESVEVGYLADKDGNEITEDDLEPLLSSNTLTVWVSLKLSKEEANRREAQNRAELQLKRSQEQPISRLFGDIGLWTDVKQQDFLKDFIFNCKLLDINNEPLVKQEIQTLKFGTKPPNNTTLIGLLEQQFYNSLSLEDLEKQSQFCKNLLMISYIACTGETTQSAVLMLISSSSTAFKKASVSAKNISNTAGRCAQSTLDIFASATATVAQGNKEEIDRAKRGAVTSLKQIATQADNIAKEAEENANSFLSLADKCREIGELVLNLRAQKKSGLDKVKGDDIRLTAELNTAVAQLRGTRKKLEKQKEELKELKEELKGQERKQENWQITALATQTISAIASTAVALSSPYSKVTSVIKDLGKLQAKGADIAEQEKAFNQQKEELKKLDKSILEKKNQADNLESNIDIDKVTEAIIIIDNLISDSKNDDKEKEKLKQDVQEVRKGLEQLKSGQLSEEQKASFPSKLDTVLNKAKSLFTKDETSSERAQKVKYLQEKQQLLKQLYVAKGNLAHILEQKKAMAAQIKEAGKEIADAARTYAQSLESKIEDQRKQVATIKTEKTKLEEKEEEQVGSLGKLMGEANQLAVQKVDLEVAVLILSVAITSLSRLGEIYVNFSLFWKRLQASAQTLAESSLSAALEKIELTELSREVALEWYYNIALWLALQNACSKYFSFAANLGEEIDKEFEKSQSTPEEEMKMVVDKLKKADKIPNLVAGAGEQLKNLLAKQEKLAKQAEADRNKALQMVNDVLMGS